MRNSLGWIAAGGALALLGLLTQFTPKPAPIGPVVVVTATYPGAAAELAADAVAAPLEQQINGVEGLLRIESESRNDGRYLARVRFETGVDPARALDAVRARAALAAPQLPEAVRENEVKVEPAATPEDATRVILALVDRENRGRAALQEWGAAVEKRLAAEGGAREPVRYPSPDVPRMVLQIDREKCLALGVTTEAARQAGQYAGPATTPEAFQKLTVKNAKGEDVPLSTVASLQQSSGPAAVYRLNLHPAMRIAAFPPQDESRARAAARWAKLAEEGRPAGFAVEVLAGE